MKNGVNGYRGLNQDTSYDSIQQFYIDALDIRISTAKGESMGSVTNLEGNTLYTTIPTSGTFNSNPWTASLPEIIGHTTIRNKIILFVADNFGNKGWIYELTYNENDLSLGALTLKYYNPSLNFKKEWPIEAIGRYESDCIQRIYWADYNNAFRTINLEDPNITSITVDTIDAFPNVEFTQPLLSAVLTGGTLEVGTYQYGYRLTTFDGKQTLVSPGSNLISCVNDLETNIQSAQYNGAPLGTNSGKSHEITVDTSNYSEFDTIELISVFYNSLTNTPEVLSVETKTIGGASSVSFLHTGTEITAVVLDPFEFALRQYPFKIFKSLTAKDNSLVIANTKAGEFTLNDLLEAGETFDSRTKRYNSGGILEIPSPDNDDLWTLAFNESYNLDAHWDEDWHDNKQYKYQSDGITLGGQGANITYNFNLQSFNIDGSETAGFVNLFNNPQSVNLNDGYTYNNTTYQSQISPFVSGLLRGYKRGETYRFGIVFYNNKGEASFVEYIGDIKFPDISEADGANNITSSPYFPLSQEISRSAGTIVTKGYALGIEFTIDFSTCPTLLDKITGYQIVRVKREFVDSRRVCSGLIKPGTEASGIGPDIENYDMRGPNNEPNVYHILPWIPGYGFSGTFYSINNDFHVDREGGTGPLVRGSYLHYCSPELSFDVSNYRNNIVDVSNSCLLVTGAYAQYYSTAITDGITSLDNIYEDDKSYKVSFFGDTVATEGFGVLVDDRKTCRTVLPVDKSTTLKSLEAIKQWKAKEFISYLNESQDDAILDLEFNSVTKDIDGTIFRGLYAFHLVFDSNTNYQEANLNKPGDSAPGFTNISAINKGARGLIGKVENIENDPLTTDPLVTYSLRDDFMTQGNKVATYPNGLTVLPSPVAITATPVIPNTSVELSKISTPIVDTLIPRSEIYGGFTKEVLDFNVFNCASPIINKTNIDPISAHSFKVYGGDIFLNMWTFQEKSAWTDRDFFEGFGTNSDYEFSINRTSTVAIAIESKINIGLAHGATIKTGVRNTVVGGPSGITNEIWRQEIENTETDYGEGLDMYLYNDAYSREKDTISFFTNSNTNIDCSAINDVRAYISNVKTNGETVDSWTQFGVNNYYDVDDNGPINKILNWKDNVFFFQDKGVGAYSINPRAVVTASDGIPTELGSGEGFQDHQYITNEHGSIHQWGIKSTDTGIYYFDAIHKKIFRVTGQNEPLSEIGGLHSFLNNLEGDVFLRKENGGDNPILEKGVLVSKDKINDEVLFTFYNTFIPELLLGNTSYIPGDIVYAPEANEYYIINEAYTSGDIKDEEDLLIELASYGSRYTPKFNKTLVYDELMQSFSSFYSTTPSVFLENGNILLSTNPDDKKEIYIHNVGNFGEFYGSVEESYIKLVLNAEADINKVLRFIEFNSIVRDKNKNIDRFQTITGFRVETEYQDTGKITDLSRVKRKFDKWRLKIPRDKDNSRARLRSSHFTLTLYFDNTYNKELILNRIISFFDIQMY